MKYMEYHKFISETAEEEYLITNFASLCGPFGQTNHALYNMSNRLRELFNLSRRIPLNEHDLRRYFGYLLTLSDEKLQKSVTVDRDIILFIESLDRMKDSFGSNSAKNWLPKTYPRRVKCVLTCTKAKESQITARLNCSKIFVQNKDSPEEQIKAIWSPYFVDPPPSEQTNESERKKESATELARVMSKTEKPKKASNTSLHNSREQNEKELPLQDYNNKLVSVFLELPDSLRKNFEFAQMYFGLLLQNPTNREVGRVLH